MNKTEVSILFLSVTLLIAAFFDLKFRRIPNWLTFAAIFIGIVFNSVTHGLNGFLLSMAGLFLGLAILILFYFLGGIGGGDVKLMGAVGALLGPKSVFIAFLATALIGGMYAFMLLLFHGQLSKTLNRYWLILKTGLLTGKVLYVPPAESEKKPRLCYGAAIALGTILSVAMKNSIYEMLHLD